MSKIRKSVIMEKNKKRVKELFHLMDSDADGYLDYYEMKAALKALGFTVKKSYVLTIMRMYDKHNCNKICFDDFNYVVLEKLSKQSSLDEIKYAFRFFKNNSLNDKIMIEDLQKLNEQLECNLTIEEMKLMIKEFDLDEDGCINESEFIEIMIDIGV